MEALLKNKNLSAMKWLIKLPASGAVTEVRREDPMVCNPLGVVKNSARKPRLIVDLHYVNQHKFKYEDIRTAADLFCKGDCFFLVPLQNWLPPHRDSSSALSISWILHVLWSPA